MMIIKWWKLKGGRTGKKKKKKKKKKKVEIQQQQQQHLPLGFFMGKMAALISQLRVNK